MDAIDEFEMEVVRTVRVKVYRYQPSEPGRTMGPPEVCYEPQPEDIEFAMVLPDGRAIVPTEEETAEVLGTFVERERERAAEAMEPDE